LPGSIAQITRRSVGLEQVGFAVRERAAFSLVASASLLDWRQRADLLDLVYRAANDEPAWPPLAIFRALLMSIWYDLSNVKLAEALDDPASFRRFYGFHADEVTPERPAFVRFRTPLVAHKPARALFETVTMQLKSESVTAKTRNWSIPSSSRPQTTATTLIG
jgi:IS5 family transposase